MKCSLSLSSYLFKQLTVQFNYTSKIETKIQWKMKTFDSKHSRKTERKCKRVRVHRHTHTHTHTPTIRWHRFYLWCAILCVHDVMRVYVNKIEEFSIFGGGVWESSLVCTYNHVRCSCNSSGLLPYTQRLDWIGYIELEGWDLQRTTGTMEQKEKFNSIVCSYANILGYLQRKYVHAVFSLCRLSLSLSSIQQ